MPRHVKNLFINSRLQGLQLWNSIASFLIGCASTGLAAFIAYSVFLDQVAKDNSLLHMQAVQFMTATALPIILGVCLVAGLLLVVPFSLFLSHRIAGPMVAIKRYIRTLREGNYDATLTLRENDELKEIVDDLQDLAKQMDRPAKSA